MEYTLSDLASVIRSKNSGPYELTFDIIFRDFETFEKARAANIINKKMFARLYNIKESDIILVIYFPPAKAVKVTIKRPIPSGALGETDVYGAQQHGPLVGVKVNL